MDIGSLTGQISIEDQLTDKLTEIANHVRKFSDDFDGAMGAVAIGVGVAVAAITGAIISITELGEKGSTILGVQNAFDHLAVSAGTTGDALRSNLNEGVKETISEFELMRSTSKLLGSGMKLTADQALLMGQAARELGKATGGDAASGLDIMSSALTTGRVRGLQQQIGLIDLAAGEKKFADSIHTTVDQLNAAGQLEGKRIAILDATKAYVDRLGISQLSFKERVLQAEEAVTEWTNKLATSVASSPHVMAALDAIQKAIEETFGGNSESLLETIVGWVNSFSDAVTRAAPTVISALGSIRDAVVGLYHFLTEHEEAIKSVAIGVGAYAAAWMTLTIGGSIVTGVLAGLKAIAVAATALEAGSLVALITPIGLVAAAVGGLVLAVYKFKKSIDDIKGVGSDTFDGLKDGAGNALISIDHLAERMKTLSGGQDVKEGLSLTVPGIKPTTGPAGDFLKDNSKEIEAATIASIAKTEQLWDEYFSVVAKMNGDSLASQISAINRWEAQQKTALDATKKNNQNYQNQLAALESDAYAKRLAASTAYNKALALGMQMVEQSVQPAVKGFENLDTSLEHLGKRSTEIEEIKTLAPGLKMVEQSIPPVTAGFYGIAVSLEEVGKKSTDIDEVRNKLTQMREEQKNFRDRWDDVSYSLGRAGQVLDVIPGKFAEVASVGLKTASDMAKAYEAGGGGLTGAINAAVAAVVDLGAALFNIGGPSKDELAGRSAFDQLRLKGETLDQTIQRIADSLVKAGKTGPEALALVQRALDGTHTSAEAVGTAIDAINNTLDTAKQAQQDLTDAVGRYGFSLAELGPTMQAQKLDEQATLLTKDWDVLVASGMNMAVVNSHMASTMNDYLQQAVKTGHDVPQAMQPIIESMIDQGLFLDANGDKITDIKDLGVTFSMTMTEGFKLVADKLQTLLEKLGLVPAAMDEMKDHGVDMADAVSDAINKIPKEISVGFTVKGGAPATAAGAVTETPSNLDAWYQVPFQERINTTFDEWVKTHHASMGGLVTASGIQPFSAGGTVLPFPSVGTDTVPTMLTPGETVSSVSDTKSNAENMSAMAAAQATMNDALDDIHRLLADQPRAIGVAVSDAVLLAPRRAA